MLLKEFNGEHRFKYSAENLNKAQLKADNISIFIIITISLTTISLTTIHYIPVINIYLQYILS